MPQNFRSNCPINQVLELLGDHWSLLIVRDILFFGRASYGDFLESPEGISTNILASRLKQLEHTGLVEMRRSVNDRKKGIYLLTEQGIELAPLLGEMMLWALKHSPVEPALPEALSKSLESDRDGTLAPFVRAYREKKQELLKCTEAVAS